MTDDNRSENESRRVRIREVGPRDGFQNEPETIATADKIRLIDALGRAGFKRIEVASFVRPDVIPQLSDGVEVLHSIDLPHDVARMVLVPNSRGLDNALGVRDLFEEVALFVSASQTHNQRNINRTIEETMADVEVMGKRIVAENLTFCAVIATSFGRPLYEGKVPMAGFSASPSSSPRPVPARSASGDTAGMCNPAYASRFFTAAAERLPGVEVTAHFHNTRGQGLANAYAALQAGCTSFESSFGELEAAQCLRLTGDIATEDLVSMFHEMGVETGLDLEAVIEAAREAQSVLGRKLTSHSLVAGPVHWHPAVG